MEDIEERAENALNTKGYTLVEALVAITVVLLLTILLAACVGAVHFIMKGW